MFKLPKWNPSKSPNANTPKLQANGKLCRKAVSFERSCFCELQIVMIIILPFAPPPQGMIHRGKIAVIIFCFFLQWFEALGVIRNLKLTCVPNRPSYPQPHLEDAYAGVPMPAMLPHDPHMNHMGMPPPGHPHAYPVHPFMMHQYM
jgi:hypothetical protein